MSDNPEQALANESSLFSSNNSESVLKLGKNRPRKRSRYIQGKNLFASYNNNNSSQDGNSRMETSRPEPAMLVAAYSQSNSGMSGKAATTTREKKQFTSSLFGAIMQKQNKEKSGENEESNQQQETYASQDVKNNVNVSSPSGAQLLSFLDRSTDDSPVFDSTERQSQTSSRSIMSPPTQFSQVSETTWQEWREFDNSSKECLRMNLIDWTLMQSLRFDTQPRLSLLDSYNDARVRQQGLRHFLSGSSCSASQPVDPKVLWHSAMYYWQYPSETAPAVEKPNKRSLHSPKEPYTQGSSSNSRSYSRLMSNTSSRHRPATNRASLFSVVVADKQHNESKVQNEARVRWQQAFESVYHAFTAKGEELRDEILKQKGAADDMSNALLESYFYVCGPMQTVLFRLAVIDSGEESNVQPEIVLSSSSLRLRDQMRENGVQMRLLYSIDDTMNTEFNEKLLSTPASTRKIEDPTESQSIQAQLQALRQSHVSNQFAGADVSILLHKKSKKKAKSRRLPPLVIRGWDGCQKLYKLYHKLCGDAFGKAGSDHDPPFIYCRALGPFLHASLKSVQCIENGTLGAQVVKSGLSHRIEGIILPCAARALVSAGVACFDGTNSDELKDDGTTDARHLVVTTTKLSTKSLAVTPGNTGVVGSDDFNASATIQSDNANFVDAEERISTIVWNSSKPCTMVYKMERINYSIPG